MRPSEDRLHYDLSALFTSHIFLSIQRLTTPSMLQAADQWIKQHPQGTLWQSLAWKQYQEALGRTVHLYADLDDAGTTITALALVVIDRTSMGLSTWDIPRGPVWTDATSCGRLMETIVFDARAARCLAVTFSPVQELAPIPPGALSSKRHVQPTATRVISLQASEAEILVQMHPKGRYNIGVAQKAGVTIREGGKTDMEAFYTLLEKTSRRDGFRIAQKSQYKNFLADLAGSMLLIAEYQQRPVAGLLGVMWNGGSIYYYGASRYEDRALMAPYALQWAAMQRSKASGCLTYDLLGVSPEPAPTQDPWRGISDFKRKFGGEIRLYPKEKIIVLRPWIQQVLKWKRRIMG